jgi:hypothetical protein
MTVGVKVCATCDNLRKHHDSYYFCAKTGNCAEDFTYTCREWLPFKGEAS